MRESIWNDEIQANDKRQTLKKEITKLSDKKLSFSFI